MGKFGKEKSPPLHTCTLIHKNKIYNIDNSKSWVTTAQYNIYMNSSRPVHDVITMSTNENMLTS